MYYFKPIFIEKMSDYTKYIIFIQFYTTESNWSFFTNY